MFKERVQAADRQAVAVGSELEPQFIAVPADQEAVEALRRGEHLALAQRFSRKIKAEQTRASGIVQELAGLETLALPLQIDAERVGGTDAPPALGAQSAEVLAELGYSRAEIDALAAAGVTRLA